MTSPDPLAPLLEAPETAGILVDFDGSLAPIVEDPATSRPLPGVVEVLARLVARFGLVGVVSGRPASFLALRLPVDGLELVGVYGMERWIGGEVVVDERVSSSVGALRAAREEVETALPGLLIERKGDLSFVLHWRTDPEQEEHALETGRAVAESLGLAAEVGRRALEIRAPVPLDKGVATQHLLDGMDTGLFAGDDRGDLAAFDGLDAMVSDGRLRAAVKVAVVSPEAPPELLARADERVDGPEALLDLLRGLAR